MAFCVSCPKEMAGAKLLCTARRGIEKHCCSLHAAQAQQMNSSVFADVMNRCPGTAVSLTESDWNHHTPHEATNFQTKTSIICLLILNSSKANGLLTFLLTVKLTSATPTSCMQTKRQGGIHSRAHNCDGGAVVSLPPRGWFERHDRSHPERQPSEQWPPKSSDRNRCDGGHWQSNSLPHHNH